jgi:hypothetical protein
VNDPYAVSAEFLAVLYRGMWPHLTPVLQKCLIGVDVQAGPVLDLGAGNGMGTSVVLDTVQGSTVLAVEPSPAMRAALFAHVLNREDGAARVTVLPCSSDDLVLPDSLGGMIGINVLVHLSPAQRCQLWTNLFQRLAPGAPAIVNVQQPETPQAIPRTEGASSVVGRLRYSAELEAEPDGPESMVWTTFYSVYDEADLIFRSYRYQHFWVISTEQLMAELSEAGFHVDPQEMGFMVARRLH